MRVSASVEETSCPFVKYSINVLGYLIENLCQMLDKTPNEELYHLYLRPYSKRKFELKSNSSEIFPINYKFIRDSISS